MSRFYCLVSCSNLHGTQIYFLGFPNVSFTKLILGKKRKKNIQILVENSTKYFYAIFLQPTIFPSVCHQFKFPVMCTFKNCLQLQCLPSMELESIAIWSTSIRLFSITAFQYYPMGNKLPSAVTAMKAS